MKETGNLQNPLGLIMLRYIYIEYSQSEPSFVYVGLLEVLVISVVIVATEVVVLCQIVEVVKEDVGTVARDGPVVDVVLIV